MKLSPAERETIILFSDADKTANVYTHDARLIKKLRYLSEEYPDKIYSDRKEHPGAVSYVVPKRCVQIHAPYSEERREAARQRALKYGFKRKITDSDS